MPTISRRAYGAASSATSWEELFEAGPYYARISELLEDARDFAIFVGWQIDSRLPMPRPWRPGQGAGKGSRQALAHETLRDKIIRLCNEKPHIHFYILMWDHAYLYAMERETLQGRVWDEVHDRVHFVFDNRHPFGGSHHEKVVIVDGRVALCGGIDLCAERWDSEQHLFSDPRRSLDLRRERHGPYHELAVQVTGSVCREIQRNVERRWHLLSSVPFPEPPPARSRPGAGHKVYLSRTVAGVDADDLGIREIEFMARDLVRSARGRLLLEGQYYWSEFFNELLIAKMREMRNRPFELVLILTNLTTIDSLTRQMAYHQMRLLKRLTRAGNDYGTRLTVGTPAVFSNQPAAKPRHIYVHSKLILVDDYFLSIGSANMAARAFRFDTELNLTLEATSAAEQRHINRFANEVLHHWNTGNDPDRNVRLLLVDPAREAKRIRRRSPVISRLPWNKIFDPPVPWLFFIKRRFRKVLRTRFPVVPLLFVALVFLGTASTILLSGASGTMQTLYAGTLASVWLIPVPFVALSLLATLQFGMEAASQIAISALWSAAVLGYCLTRMFPNTARNLYAASSPSWLGRLLGLRAFPKLISVLADPRINLRSKIALQGLYCVPLPWFVLGTLLVMPGALRVFCIGIGALRFLPLQKVASVISPVALALSLGVGVLSVAISFKNLARHTKPCDRKGDSKDFQTNIERKAA